VGVVVGPMECVVNVSEGRDSSALSRLRESCGPHLLDVHSDPDHNRSVFTLCGRVPDVFSAVCSLATAVVETLDLGGHSGAHPRIGTLDVVPWVSLMRDRDGMLVDGGEGSVEARARFASWAGSELQLPCFLYGFGFPTLPEVRRRAWVDLAPANGPSFPHPRAGSCAVGARPVLVAYNLWLASVDLTVARSVARELRLASGGRIRTLGLQVGPAVQVSCNLIDPWVAGPGAAFDFVSSRTAVERCELVGLVPAAVLNAEPRHRWAELGIDPSTTIEARLEQAGLDGGRFEHR
jgi:glutamate formiminotransferase